MSSLGYSKQKQQQQLPRLSVRDSFGGDDDDLSDIDDEVFIRTCDGKNGGILKLATGALHRNNDDDDDYECGVKRPLMAPRRKTKNAHFNADQQQQQQQYQQNPSLPLKTLFAPFLYTMLGFVFIMAIIALCIVAITRLPLPTGLIKGWLAREMKPVDDGIKGKASFGVPCTSLDSQLQWTRTLPKLTSEAPLRSNDVNGDDVLDVIVGFSTGLDTSSASDFTCKLYFDRNAPCLGGILALDGRTGETLWTHWTNHAVFSVDCGLDLTGDNTKDCVIAGRGGILHAVDGRNGNSIWELPSDDLTRNQRYYDIYDARYIVDMDYDGVADVVASHTWENEGSRSEVILVSGKSGTKINEMDFPGKEQLFVAPQVIVHPDGETYLVLVASDRQKSGGLYIIPHSKLLKGEFKLQRLYHGPGRGVSLPPLLIDVNSDGTEDIIVAMANSTILAFDGLTFKEIWNFTIVNSEVISIPVPGFYNDDKIPDFMVKHQVGPGFPVYYYTTATVLDGKTGKPLLETPIEDTMSAQMSGLSVTVDGYGNDWFLHWSADCLGKEGAKDAYQFFREPPDSDADLCKLRFNSSLSTSLYAFSQHVGPPGLALYRSEDWKSVEFNNSIDPRRTAEEYVNGHSDQFGQDEILSQNQQQSNFYPKTKDVKYESGRGEEQQQQQQQQQGNFLDRALEDANENAGWKQQQQQQGIEDPNYENRENVQPDYDDDEEDAYDDAEEQRMIASRQLNEIRLQRSEKSSGRYINNDTNDVQNQLDPSMDYTNGQSKQSNFYTTLHFNRSNNSDDSSDYMNIPDIDFVDNIKEAEALSDRRRRRRELKNEKTSALKQNSESSKQRNYKINVRVRKSIKNPFTRLKREKRRQQQQHPPGMQRQPPTGILLPSLTKTEEKKKTSVDLVFSTYWLPASSTPFVLLPRDLECVKKAAEQRNVDEKTLTSQEREALVIECLVQRGINYESYQEATDKENSKISLGQMTIYRMRLTCVCPEDMLAGQSCRDIAKEQSWPEHLGASVSGYFEAWRK